MPQKVWIRGSRTNPQGVIAALEKLGGKNIRKLNASNPNVIFFIDDEDTIYGAGTLSFVGELIMTNPEWMELSADHPRKFSPGDLVAFNCAAPPQAAPILPFYNIEDCGMGENPWYTVSQLGNSFRCQESDLRPYKNPGVLTASAAFDFYKKNAGSGFCWLIERQKDNSTKIIASSAASPLRRAIKWCDASFSIAITMPFFGGIVPMGRRASIIDCASYCKNSKSDPCDFEIKTFEGIEDASTPLRFHTKELAEKFLAYNRELCESFLFAW